MNMKIFSLLHLDEHQETSVNLPTKNFQEQLLVYVSNAIVLSKTLESQGIEFTLLTNKKPLIEETVLKLQNNQVDSFSLNVLEIPFVTNVPSGVKFYSAHYKLDAFRYFASLNDGYLALCDLDVICINAVPDCLRNLIKAEIPLYYDISDQVIPAEGHDVIIRDLSTISGLASEGRWSGGEFVAGTPRFFKELVKEIDSIYDNYISNISSFHHVSEEPITSAALEKLRRQGNYIADAGSLGIIGRYWNVPVLHPQKPFSYFESCFLLHLPADKKFLGTLVQYNQDILSQFKILYSKHRNQNAYLNPKRFVFKHLNRSVGLIKYFITNLLVQKRFSSLK